MARKKPAKIWLWRFQTIDNVEGLEIELKGLDALIELENKYPVRGEDVYKLMIRKKILVQSKIRLLKGRNVANG